MKKPLNPFWGNPLSQEESTQKNEKKCLHDSCVKCHGTGTDQQGRPCIHMIHCNCSKCKNY